MSESAENSESHGKSHKSHGGGHGHGGGHEEAHEGAPEWLISFADMVMLMMGFFVILFALNNKPTGRMPGGAAAESEGGDPPSANEHVLDFAIGVREAFHNPVDVNSTDPRDAALVKRLLQRAGKGEARDPGIKGSEQDVQSIRPADYYALSGSVPFPENSADLPAAARPTIAEIARKVRGLRLVVEVRGHVSSVEASKGHENAMQLAMSRAMTVAKALAAEGVAWWQLRLIGSADHDRVEAYPSNRSIDKANARVEVILTDQVVPDEVPTRYESGSQANAMWPGPTPSERESRRMGG